MHHSVTPARRSAAIAVLAALALIPRALAAEEAPEDEIPAGHLYFGLAGETAQPFGRALISRNALKLGTATGLYLHFEEEHFLVGAEIAGGHFGHDDRYSNPFMLAVRAGPVSVRRRIAPYFAAGPALLAFGAIGDDAENATGLSGQIGVLLFRQLRWFRATAFLQYNLPIWRGAGKGAERDLVELGRPRGAGSSDRQTAPGLSRAANGATTQPWRSGREAEGGGLEIRPKPSHPLSGVVRPSLPRVEPHPSVIQRSPALSAFRAVLLTLRLRRE
jgi:hypothetical protein